MQRQQTKRRQFGKHQKYQKFELESHEKLNSWDFLMELPSFVNRYITTHKREEEITEKIFVNNPVSNNTKVPIKLEEHLQEMLQKTPEKHKPLDLKKYSRVFRTKQ